LDWIGSNRADAEDISGGLYQEINETGGSAEEPQFEPAAPTSGKSSGGGDQHVIRRIIYSGPKHTLGSKMVMPIPDVEVIDPQDFAP
jgi:hypothetical protein